MSIGDLASEKRVDRARDTCALHRHCGIRILSNGLKRLHRVVLLITKLISEATWN